LKYLIFLLLFALPAQAEIIIGVAGPMTGPYAAFGKALQDGAQLAVDDLNAKGGIAGEEIKLQPEDDECKDRSAESAAQDLISKRAAMVVGHYCSYPALAAAKLYEKAGVVMIAPTASLPALTEAGLNNIIRLAPRDDRQADVAASFVTPSKKLAVLSDGTIANVTLAEHFSTALSKPALINLSFKPDATEFDGLINDIKLQNISAIYLACSAADAAHIALALQAANVRADLFGPDTLLVDQYWEIAGDAAEGTMVTFAADPLSTTQAKPIIAALKTAGIDASSASIGAYAAVQLFAAAPNNTIETLKSGQSFSTALGPVSFDAKGDLLRQRFVWYKWSKGKYSEVK
jgi:branched-chain amino acid transport system substrate-binding protein